MPEVIGGLWDIINALLSGDAFAISDALNSPAAYLFGAVLAIGGGLLVMFVLRSVPFLDLYFEKSVLVVTYLVIAGVIFVEVIRRFVFQVQVPWSTTIPPYLFLIMTWVGCAYGTRLRAHLSFTELRINLPRLGQLMCMTLDAVLWVTFAVIVIVTTLKQTANSAANFQILLGTDNVMQWWFYVCVPLSWILLSGRVIENAIDDFRRYRAGEEMVLPSGLGGE
ncbi:MAG: TRAP transporter small permease subunit [Rhodomicrobium sp.]|nr:TRAP transporter small permease subunit [Rhodomicrobium sp.]